MKLLDTKGVRAIFLALMAVLLVAAMPALAQEGEDDDDLTCNHPKVSYLVNLMDVECQVLLDLEA